MLSIIARRVKEYRDFRQALAALQQADDRMLADIGLNRNDLRRALQNGRR